MAAFGAINPQVYFMQRILPPRGLVTYSSGLVDKDKGYVKYAAPSSTNPTLIIANPVYDNDDNLITPGYYELVLSGDRTMLTLTQAGKEIAVFPVFKIEEDKTQETEPQPMDNKSQREFNKEQQKKEKKRQKQIRKGEIPDDEPQIYTNASIEYDTKGDYYLIKYERGKIRAWGAIK